MGLLVTLGVDVPPRGRTRAPGGAEQRRSCRRSVEMWRSSLRRRRRKASNAENIQITRYLRTSCHATNITLKLLLLGLRRRISERREEEKGHQQTQPAGAGAHGAEACDGITLTFNSAFIHTSYRMVTGFNVE